MERKESNEVIDYCANPECGAEIIFRQPVIRCGKDLYCGSECLFTGVGATVIRAEGTSKHENDPTG